MNIKLPLETMIEGLGKGGAGALTARPKGKIRLSATKLGIKIESGDDHGWVVHSIPTSKSVSVQEEGAWNLGGTEVDKMIKALGSRGQKANTTSAPCLTLKYSPPPKEAQPQDDKSVGSLDWVVDDGDDGGRMEGSFPAFLVNSVNSDNSDKQLNVFSGKQDGECLLELNTVALNKMIQQVAATKNTVLSSCGGLTFISTATKDSAVVREFTPSENVTGVTKDFNVSLTGMAILEILKIILTGAKKTIKSVGIYLGDNGRVLKWVIGNTECFFLIEPKKLFEPVEFLSRMNMTPPRTSFTVQADTLLNRLETIILSTRKNDVHASLGALGEGGGEAETIFKLEYLPSKPKGKRRPTNHPAEATMRCHDIDGDSAIRFSFAPKTVRDFVRAAKDKQGGLIAISVITKGKERAGRAVMRVQAINNPHLAFFTPIVLEPPVA
jgi:hypothetical protein